MAQVAQESRSKIRERLCTGGLQRISRTVQSTLTSLTVMIMTIIYAIGNADIPSAIFFGFSLLITVGGLAVLVSKKDRELLLKRLVEAEPDSRAYFYSKEGQRRSRIADLIMFLFGVTLLLLWWLLLRFWL